MNNDTHSAARAVRTLQTRSGKLVFPQYVPVTTYGQKYPLDNLVRPFLPRLARAVMVSFHYAQNAKEHPGVPMLVDSGGFASLFEWATVREESGLGHIELNQLEQRETLTPSAVLDFQEKVADVAFTLDFPIPPALAAVEGPLRQRLTIANALWASHNRRRRDLPLYACVQGWDLESYLSCSAAYVGAPFEGVAVGGLVPRARDRELVLAVVKEVRRQHPDKALHVFGLGQPGLVSQLFEAGADSVDSSAYVKLAADGIAWGSSRSAIAADLSPLDRMHLALANLATASQRALPLGFAQVLFRARHLDQ
jgi:queuine/archaeosine tRNA-ribosyltransferase